MPAEKPLPANQWVTITGIYDNGIMKLYVNDKLQNNPVAMSTPQCYSANPSACKTEAECTKAGHKWDPVKSVCGYKTSSSPPAAMPLAGKAIAYPAGGGPATMPSPTATKTQTSSPPVLPKSTYTPLPMTSYTPAMPTYTKTSTPTYTPPSSMYTPTATPKTVDSRPMTSPAMLPYTMPSPTPSKTEDSRPKTPPILPMFGPATEPNKNPILIGGSLIPYTTNFQGIISNVAITTKLLDTPEIKNLADNGCGGIVPTPVCGDNICAAQEATGSCPQDCKVAPVPGGMPECGDGKCEGAEISTCPDDCVVPTKTADPGSKTCTPRPACLDSIPACYPPVPAGGWCPKTVSPTPAPPPCGPSNPPVCKTKKECAAKGNKWCEAENICKTLVEKCVEEMTPMEACRNSGGQWCDICTGNTMETYRCYQTCEKACPPYNPPPQWRPPGL